MSGRISFVLVVAALVGWAGSAVAGPVNTRPVPVSGTNLQGVLDSVYVGGPGINAETDQDPSAIFSSTASGGSIMTYVGQEAPSSFSSVFGIYSSNDPSNRVPIFNSLSVPGEQRLVGFWADGTILVNGVPAGIGFKDPSSFGFYLEIMGDQPGVGGPPALAYTVFTEDSLNTLAIPGGEARALAFRGDNQTQLQLPGLGSGVMSDAEFILAFEDSPPGAPGADFADMVVMVESLVPIPEPATGLLAGMGLWCMSWASRRRS